MKTVILVFLFIALAGSILNVASLSKQRHQIAALRAENYSLRAECETYQRLRSAEIDSLYTAYKDTLDGERGAIYLGDGRTLSWHNPGWGRTITPADSAGVHTINDLFLRVRELERRCK